MALFNDAVLWLQRNSIIPVVVVFTMLLVWTYWPGRKAGIERNGQIPLNDDP
jgi:cbb3-type cytochrome oxidase subunit 3